MKTTSVLWAIIIGILIQGFVYWTIPYKEVNLLDTQMWLLVGSLTLIASFLLTIFFNKKPWIIGVGISLGVVLSTVLRIVYDISFWDSTSHNLAPFEIILSGLQSLPTALIGAYLSRFFKSAGNRK